VTSADDIDALLAAHKSLAGLATWVKDERGTVAKLAVPIAVDGVVGGLILQAHATLVTDPQSGGCVLIMDGRPVQRLSIRPDHAHLNPFLKTSPAAHRGVRLAAGLSRLHPWRLNRAWPRPPGDNVPFAQMIEPEPETFAAALTIFLEACRIDGVLPPPPWEPRLL